MVPGPLPIVGVGRETHLFGPYAGERVARPAHSAIKLRYLKEHQESKVAQPACGAVWRVS